MQVLLEAPLHNLLVEANLLQFAFVMVKAELSEYIDPSVQVTDFISGVWNHDLLDLRTKELRLQAKDAVEQTLGGYHITNDMYIAIPVKGYVWSLTDTSDYDYRIIANNGEENLYNEARKKISNWVHVVDLVEQDKLIHEPKNRKPVIHSAAYELLLTPDNFIVGNIQAAQEARLKIVRYLSEPHDGHNYWDGKNDSLQDHFQAQYIQWGIGKNSKEAKPAPDQDFGKLSKHARFDILLFDRSQQEVNPLQWQRDYLKSLQSRKIPSVKVYKHALEESQGALIIPDNNLLAIKDN